jgi:hypothetical protein
LALDFKAGQTAVLIEQAIFTSAETDRAQGYQLISRSPGLSESDARELAVWGPAHDSLLEGGELESTNFHRLASGTYAISRTNVSGAEYSGRGGGRVYTQFLAVPADVLARFSNNPFAVVRAATANGALRICDEIPETLEPLRLSGRAPAVDPSLLAQLACRPGAAEMATLVQSALSSDQLAVASKTSAGALVAGLFNLLPVECRLDFSFSTGLKFSPSRPFRISILPADSAQWRAIGRHGVTLLSLDTEAESGEPSWKGWAGCVEEVLKSGRFSLLAGQLDRPRAWLRCETLPKFVDEFQRALHPRPPSTGGAPNKGAQTADLPANGHALGAAGHSAELRADARAPSIAGEKAVLATALAELAKPRGVHEDLMATLAEQPAEVLELLERVDDLVFTSIAGDEGAMSELSALWPTVVAKLDPVVVEQSKEQYLRCALSIWSECAEARLKQPERAMSAIDVLCVLFEE